MPSGTHSGPEDLNTVEKTLLDDAQGQCTKSASHSESRHQGPLFFHTEQWILTIIFLTISGLPSPPMLFLGNGPPHLSSETIMMDSFEYPSLPLFIYFVCVHMRVSVCTCAFVCVYM